MMILSQLLWETLLEEFRWPRRTVERVAYIDGFQSGERRPPDSSRVRSNPPRAYAAGFPLLSKKYVVDTGSRTDPLGIEEAGR